jgi:hypothetical protein
MTTDTFGDVAPLPLGAIRDGLADAPQSAVSWAAILAGAFVAGATSMVLLALGTGLGFASASPWPGAHPSAATFTIMTGIWLIIIQWAASGVGGYLTGRLRTRWIGVHTHEVFFRDTAHGFLAWAVATVMVALLAVGAAALATSHGGGALAAAGDAGVTGPYVNDADTLFRSTRPDDSPSAVASRLEAARIVGADVVKGETPPEDRQYLAGLVSAHTDLSPADAQARVDAVLASARQSADKARKAASAASIFTALAMLIGALIACVAAALGGQQRDEHL